MKIDLGHGLRFRTFNAAVGVTRESAFTTREYRLIRGPGPAAETGPLVIGKRLMDLVACVHDERTVLRHGFSDRPALQQQELAFVGTVVQRDVTSSIQMYGRILIQ